MTIPASYVGSNISSLLAFEVNLTGCLPKRYILSVNSYRHYSTITPDVHKTRVLFLIIAAAASPVKVFPAPHGNTIMPDLALPFPNTLLRAASW